MAPQISADGRFVLFSSSANNLVLGDNSQLGLDVFLRDRASNTTVLVSGNFSGTGGGNGNSTGSQISTNGRYVSFQSDCSDLLIGDTNDVSDVFLRDLQFGSNILVSITINGAWGSGASTDPVMTPDGRYVAFISAATNLVADDTNRLPDIFVRDLCTGSTRLVSVGATGTVATVSAPLITPDGRYIAYSSTAKGLAPGVSPLSRGEVYIRDLVANITIWASSNAAEVVSNTLKLNYAPSYHPILSEDGRFVAFKSGWANGITPPYGGGTAAAITFLYDSSTGTATSISTNGFVPWTQNDDIYGPEMSPDGRFITVVVTNQNTQSLAVQLWDAQVGTNIDISISMDGTLPTNSISDRPTVSRDGRYVVFTSNATNLTANAVSNGFHIFRRDVQAGTTQLIDTDTNGVGSLNLVTTIPTISADGRSVTFESLDGGLVNGDSNGVFDVFVKHLTEEAEMVSQHAPGVLSQSGDGLSWLGEYALSDDGRMIAFTSYADDLVPGDTNKTSDVFAYNLTAGSNALASASADGFPALGSSFSPALALGGRFVAFVSMATNLVAGQASIYGQVFLRDLVAGTNALVSVAPNAITPGNGDASAVVLSQDAQYAVFLSRAGNLATGGVVGSVNTYLRNLTNGVTTLLTNNSSTAPSISADGRYVVYGGPSTVMVRDTRFGTNVFATNSAASAVISPTGARLLLLYNSAKTLAVINLLNKSNLLTIASTTPIRYSAPWSMDGRFITIATTTNASSLDTNGTSDVYLCDLESRSLTLVSINSAHTAAANAASDGPAISGDGRFVVYRSYATDLATGVTNPPSNIFLFDRFTGTNTLLTATSPGSTWSSRNGRPMINGDGRTVVFQSWNPGMVADDLNRAQDAFAATVQPWGATDSDGNGIPDLWMTLYFGHATQQAGDLSGAQDDADGDGMTNLAEFLAGTDPTNPAATLRLQIQAQVSPANNVTLNWLAVPGKSYQVQFKESLSMPVWQEVPGVVIGNQGSITVPADQSSRFYRIVAD